jgi:hypothetical protein
VYAGLCRRDRLTSKECPFWLDSLFCDRGDPVYNNIYYIYVRCLKIKFRASGVKIWLQLLNFPAGGNVPVIFWFQWFVNVWLIVLQDVEQIFKNAETCRPRSDLGADLNFFTVFFTHYLLFIQSLVKEQHHSKWHSTLIYRIKHSFITLSLMNTTFVYIFCFVY